MTGANTFVTRGFLSTTVKRRLWNHVRCMQKKLNTRNIALYPPPLRFPFVLPFVRFISPVIFSMWHWEGNTKCHKGTVQDQQARELTLQIKNITYNSFSAATLFNSIVLQTTAFSQPFNHTQSLVSMVLFNRICPSYVHLHKLGGQFPSLQLSLHHLSIPAFPCQVPIATHPPEGGGVVAGRVGGSVDGTAETGGSSDGVGPVPPPKAILTAFIKGYLRRKFH